MKTNELIPDHKIWCDMFTGDETKQLTIKIPDIKCYVSAGFFLNNIVKGIGILAEYGMENEKSDALSIISDLVLVVDSLDFSNELDFVDKIITFSQQEELTKDEKTKILEEKIKNLQGSNNYLSNELSKLKNEKLD